MAITVKEARLALEAAKEAHTKADIEHPTAISTTKAALTNARHVYWDACESLCTKLEFSTSVADVESELIAHGLWT
jgi:hypothetical protein